MSNIVAINLSSTAVLSVEVFKANISKGAKQLYWLFCMLPQTENNKIEVPQHVLAQELKSSVSSIGRYLKELVTANFVKFLEEQVPGKVRSMMIVDKIEPVQEIKEVKPKPRILTAEEIAKRPFVQTKPFSSFVLPIDRPPEKSTTVKLDAMGEAVLEQALKESIPPGKDMPVSIDKYCEQYLYVVKPEGFMMMAYIIREQYKRQYKPQDAK